MRRVWVARALVGLAAVSLWLLRAPPPVDAAPPRVDRPMPRVAPVAGVAPRAEEEEAVAPEPPPPEPAPPPEPPRRAYALIHCPVPLPGDAEAWLFVKSERANVDEFFMRFHVERVEDGLEATLPSEGGLGELRIDDHVPVTLRWTSNGTCDAPSGPPVRLPVRFVGFVENAAGAEPGEVTVSGCGATGVRVDAQGRFGFYARSAPCTLQATRHAGPLSRDGSEVDVEPEGDEVTVHLWVPDHRPAGLGVRLAEVVEGIAVDEVYPHTPAEEAGLAAGDVLLAIDGQTTRGMSTSDFIEIGVGREGTEVELLVLGEGGERTVTLVRRVLPDPEPGEETSTWVRGRRNRR